MVRLRHASEERVPCDVVNMPSMNIIHFDIRKTFEDINLTEVVP